MSDDLLSPHPVDRLIREIIDADHLLKWATAAWAELPEVEREIDGWDLLTGSLLATEVEIERASLADGVQEGA